MTITHERLIADARDWARDMRELFPLDGTVRDDARLVDRLADALEVAEKRLAWLEPMPEVTVHVEGGDFALGLKSPLQVERERADAAEKRATEAEAEMRARECRNMPDEKVAELIAEARSYDRAKITHDLADALEEQMQDREMLVMFLRNAKQELAAALAVIEKARGMFQNDGFHESPLGRLLSSVPADVLWERDAEKWHAGAQWAAVELGAIDDERQAWITPSDNPYRTEEESND